MKTKKKKLCFKMKSKIPISMECMQERKKKKNILTFDKNKIIELIRYLNKWNALF